MSKNAARIEWLDLAERCEKANGPDREIDAAIWLASTPGATRETTHIAHWQRPYTIDETRDGTGRLIVVPEHTASLDAITTLIGCELSATWAWTLAQNTHHRHWTACLNSVGNDGVDAVAYGHSNRFPALALCAAYCRVMAERARDE